MTQDQDPEQIRDEIGQTQRELSADVDALTAKLSPQRIVHDRIQRARTAVGSMKQRVTGGAAQKASADGGTAAPAVDAADGAMSPAKGTVSSATSSAARTAGTVTAAAVRGLKANPVAAALIAFGAGWLLGALLPSPVRRSERRTE